MKTRIVRESIIVETPRVAQIAGMFDIPPAEKSRVEMMIDLPLDEREWSVGLIVGPSGAGKSSVARECFGDAVVSGFEWSGDHSIIDGFPAGCGIKEISGLLNAVGFGSVPNWLRPFHVLSNGEQFRVTMARAMAETAGLVVIDEFTSVVDRQVAKIASNCMQKTIRRTKRQFVAVSCHYDIIEWLQPDWVYEPHLAAFEWRSVQRRPEIAVEIRSVSRNVWPRFSHHHYLSASLHNTAVCIGGFIGGECVAFCSAIPFPHPIARNIWTEHRTVVLPEYQGLGIGGMLAGWLGMYLWERGWRFHSTPSHPAIIAQKAASPRWRMLRYGVGNAGSTKPGAKRGGLGKHQRQRSARRVSASFAFCAPAGSPSARKPERTGLLLGRKTD